jgi:hypothetical protein
MRQTYPLNTRERRSRAIGRVGNTWCRDLQSGIDLAESMRSLNACSIALIRQQDQAAERTEKGASMSCCFIAIIIMDAKPNRALSDCHEKHAPPLSTLSRATLLLLINYSKNRLAFHTEYRKVLAYPSKLQTGATKCNRNEMTQLASSTSTLV